MHTLILLTGPDVNNKLNLIDLMRNVKHVDADDGKGRSQIIEAIESHSGYCETVVVTTKDPYSYLLLTFEKMLRNHFREYRFYHFKL